MKLLIIISMLTVFSTDLLAATPEVTTKCSLLERASGIKSKTEILDITTLGAEGEHSVAMKTQMGIDSDALYILSLSKGKDHLDATNEVSGSDYYLSLSRLQDETKAKNRKNLKGSLSDMVFLQVKYDSLFKTSYTNRKGKHIYGVPKSLVLDYKLSRGKRVKLKCEIISIR